MKTLILLALTLSLSANAATLKEYRAQSGLSRSGADEIEKAAQTRIANIRAALGYKNLRFVEPNTPLQNATRGLTSSTFLKRLLSQVGEAYKSYESTGKPMTLDPSLFGYEIDRAVDQRNQNICMQVIGTDKYTSNRESLINQIYGQSLAQSKMREKNLAADVANGYQSALSNAIVEYINKNGQSEILTKLGTIYQIEAVDGMVTRMRMTRKTNVKGFPAVIQSDNDSLSLSLEMLATMVSGYDTYFLQGSACLVNLLNAEVQKQDKELHSITDSWLYKYTCQGCALVPPMRNRMAKLKATQRYLQDKYKGAIVAHNALTGLDRKALFFLADLMLQLRRDDVPSGKEIVSLQQLIGAKAKSGQPITDITNDQQYYANLEDELFRVEEYVREYNRSNKVNQDIINEIKKGGGK